MLFLRLCVETRPRFVHFSSHSSCYNMRSSYVPLQQRNPPCLPDALKGLAIGPRKSQRRSRNETACDSYRETYVLGFWKIMLVFFVIKFVFLFAEVNIIDVFLRLTWKRLELHRIREQIHILCTKKY